jgi:hypothetical protein
LAGWLAGWQDYKSQAHVQLFLSSKPLHDVVLKLSEHAKYVAVKLPRNADISAIEQDSRLDVVSKGPVSSFLFCVVRAAKRPEPAKVDPRAEKLMMTLLKSPQFVDMLTATMRR